LYDSRELFDEETVQTPPKKEKNTVFPEFKTMLTFSQSLFKSFVIPESYTFTALLQGDIQFVILKNQPEMPSLPELLNPLKLSCFHYVTDNAQKFTIVFRTNQSTVTLGALGRFIKLHNELNNFSNATEKETNVFPKTTDEFIADFQNGKMPILFELYSIMCGQSYAMLFHFLNWFLFNLTDRSHQALKMFVPDVLPVLSMDSPHEDDKRMIDLVEMFYGVVYNGHPRRNEWKLDKHQRHKTKTGLSQTELKRFSTHYQTKGPLLPTLLNYVVFKTH